MPISGARAYLTALAALLSLVLIAASALVPQSPRGDTRTQLINNPYGDASIFLDRTQREAPEMFMRVTENAPFVYTPKEEGRRVRAIGEEFSENLSFGGNEMPSYTLPPQQSYSTRGSSFLISQKAERKDTPQQAALRSYGNTLGSMLSAFDATHARALVILEAYFKDRSSERNRINLASISRDYSDFSQKTANLLNIPEEVGSLHGRLSASYALLGATMRGLTESGGDEATIAAITSYNSAVEENMRAFLAASSLFSAYEIEFSAAEPGYVFSFRPSGGF